ncbi:MAG: branched-chain amino acid transport system substrate-binding protein [Alphaproteobacteria bacterium]|jgi:branched-chain amino acid transport system substrate-binding protein|nr:branched-chain amino acid transport system substrate-binding protein [Alphaproteobacteria bacterium]
MKRAIASLSVGICASLLLCATAFAQDIKIGNIYDQTGPFAGGGSKAASIGGKIAIDMINERGGVEGHKIVAINADAQSKVDVAINEAERLLNEQKVDVVMGVYSSAQCVPMAAKVDAAKKLFWANVCVSSAVFKGKNLQYVFRANIHSDQYGEASCSFINDWAKSKFGKEPKDLKIAIIYEDGPYGVGVAQANEERCKAFGMQIVHKESYSATATDLSAMVSKLRRAQPDIILHTGYNPDITLFLRQAKEAGLKFQALIGHGAGYSQIDKLYETFKDDVNYLLDVDPVPAQLLDAKTLAPGLGDLTAEMVKRYKAETGANEVPPHTSMGFNQTWIFLTDVLPRAIKKYGGYDPEALRKAALDTDIPIGGTIQGYGVKFFPPGTPMAGQNERSIAVVMQFVNGKTTVVWPKEIKTAEPVVPFPKGHAYAK